MECEDQNEVKFMEFTCPHCNTKNEELNRARIALTKEKTQCFFLTCQACGEEFFTEMSLTSLYRECSTLQKKGELQLAITEFDIKLMGPHHINLQS